MRYWSNYHPAGTAPNASRDWPTLPIAAGRNAAGPTNRVPRYGPPVHALARPKIQCRRGARARSRRACVYRVRASARTLPRPRPTPPDGTGKSSTAPLAVMVRVYNGERILRVRARVREHSDVPSERVCVVFVYWRVRGCVRACACVNCRRICF